MESISMNQSLNRSMRILAIIPDNGKIGCMPFCHRQVKSIKENGVEIESFLLSSRTSSVSLLLAFIRCRKLIKNFKPDVIHSHYGSVTALFSLLCAFRLPLLITFRGSDLNSCPGDSVIRNFIALLASQVAAFKATSVVCVSEQLRSRLWCRSENAFVIPAGVNIKMFTPGSKKDARGILGWGMDEKIVLFNARNDPVGKRLDLASASVEFAKLRISSVKLKVLDGNIPPGAMPLYYNASDCLLMTSDYEGSPNVVKEAIACSLPVVSVDVGDVKQRLDGVAPSEIVASKPEEIGKAICAILMSCCRSNGKDKTYLFSEEYVASRMLNVYSQMLKPLAVNVVRD